MQDLHVVHSEHYPEPEEWFSLLRLRRLQVLCGSRLFFGYYTKKTDTETLVASINPPTECKYNYIEEKHNLFACIVPLILAWDGGGDCKCSYTTLTSPLIDLIGQQL